MSKQEKPRNVRDEAEGMDTSLDPNLDPAREDEEEYLRLKLAVQRAINRMNREQDRNPGSIQDEIEKALLECGEYFDCDLDERWPGNDHRSGDEPQDDRKYREEMRTWASKGFYQPAPSRWAEMQAEFSALQLACSNRGIRRR
jgi:hypothetical protein